MIDSKAPPFVRDLVLVGGGHAHIQVLRSFAMRPEPGVRITLISPTVDSPYSGMLPGFVAGQYDAEELHIDLVNLCQFAGARLILSNVTGLDPVTGGVHLKDRPEIRYDFVSLNCGATPQVLGQHATRVKPISEFVPKWVSVLSIATAGDSLAVVGAGAGGVELAFAMRQALPDVHIHLVGPQLLSGSEGLTRTLQAEFERYAITWHAERVAAEQSGELKLTSGATLQCEHMFSVTGVQALPWLAECGLQTDDLGFVSVSSTLQSLSHPNVFAAGDTAHMVGQERAKSGVYAVRAGPYLAQNLRRALRGEKLKDYRAQTRHLAILGFGDGRAMAIRGDWHARGNLWWSVKQQIDRRFMARFNNLPQMSEPSIDLPPSLREDLPDDVMRCGGCGAKVAAEPLRRVLSKLTVKTQPHVQVGIGDDAAQVTLSSGTQLLSVDGFRAMIDDPHLFGRIAAHHSLNDIFAMGGRPTTALALVTVPFMAAALVEEDLFQLLSGAVSVLNEHDVMLVGGHSAEGAEMSIGLTIMGDSAQQPLVKTDVRVGQRLILTKALGTGVVLAGAMQGRAQAHDFFEVLQGMDQTNAPAVAVLRDAGATALTDVTGFGLLGHLGEMLRGAGLGVTIKIENVPMYKGINGFANVASSLQNANELTLDDYELRGGLLPNDARVRTLVDPQTSGGLLASVPESHVEDCLHKLRLLGYPAAEIGTITAGSYVLT